MATQHGSFFVYGTLMRGGLNRPLIEPWILNAQKATLSGRLYHLTLQGYPMLFDGVETVHGEWLEVLDERAVLQVLDPLEDFIAPGHPDNHYERCRLPVRLESGEMVEAWVYRNPGKETLAPAEPAEWVVGGNWLEYFQMRGST